MEAPPRPPQPRPGPWWTQEDGKRPVSFPSSAPRGSAGGSPGGTPCARDPIPRGRPCVPMSLCPRGAPPPAPLCPHVPVPATPASARVFSASPPPPPPAPVWTPRGYALDVCTCRRAACVLRLKRSRGCSGATSTSSAWLRAGSRPHPLCLPHQRSPRQSSLQLPAIWGAILGCDLSGH